MRAPKQRFVDLKVGEVSLVDSPANEQEFIVVKRLNQEDGDMADEIQDVTKGQPDGEQVSNEPAAKGAEQVNVEVASTEAVEKAMAQVTQLVESIAKAANASEPSEVDTEKADAEKMDAEKGDWPKMRKQFESELKACGVKGGAMTKAMERFDKAFMPFKPGGGAKPPLKKAEKSMDDTADESVQKILEVLSMGVQKAKAFTPKREEALKAAVETLQDLLKELSMQSIPQGESPKTTVPTGHVYGPATTMALTKSIEGLKEILTTKLDEVQTVAKSLGARVEVIEKTAGPSKSLEGDGGTDTNVKKSFWSGVL